jgi:hypothetical protein
VSISNRKQILVTGATGYVGGRLVNSLLSNNLDVKIFVRDINKTRSHSWAKKVNIATGNALNYKETSFAPRGIGGHRWTVKPFHNFIFPIMIKNIISSSKQRDFRGKNASI